jgi:hypothetical protein
MLILVKMYIGSVVGITPGTGVISFNIKNFAELGGLGVASPATKLSRTPIVGEEVLLIQPNSDIEIFVYFTLNQDELGISIQNGTGFVRVTSLGVVNINNNLEIDP